MTMKILAPELDRVVQNILLYVNPKSPNLTEVFFTFLHGRLNAYCSDDYVTITDSCEVDSTDKPTEFVLSIADVKKLGEYIKLDKKVVHKSVVELNFKHTLVKVSSNDSDTEETFSFVKEPAYPLWDIVMELLNEEAEEHFIMVNAFRPERLAKLARLKADKEAPVDMRGVVIRDCHFVQFRYGETITGCIKPVDRSYVDDNFLWNQEA